jgi:hypothetical protein
VDNVIRSSSSTEIDDESMFDSFDSLQEGRAPLLRRQQQQYGGGEVNDDVLEEDILEDAPKQKRIPREKHKTLVRFSAQI